jgi:hypothetical protein
MGTMPAWKQVLQADPTDWLLVQGAPWVQYRTWLDILDRDEGDPQASLARADIAAAAPLQTIFDQQRPDGGWEGEHLVSACSSQHQGDALSLLAVFADFGLTVEDDGVAKACEFALRFQVDNGEFRVNNEGPQHYICYSAQTLQALATLGLAGDPRVQLGYQRLVDTQRLDGGWIHSKSAQPGKRREHIPSCPHATLNALGALAAHSQLRESRVARDGAEVALRHWQEKSRPYGWGIGSTWPKLKYPYTWYGLLKYVDVLCRFPWLKQDPRLREVIDVLLDKQDDQGRWKAESIYKYWSAFCFGQKKEPSPWITLLALRSVRRVCA